MKPPYAIPSMKEIAAIEPNGYRVVSTFSGCGGSCLGFRMEGFAVAWASEFIEAAREAYELNHPTKPDPRDIRDVTGVEILEAVGAQVGEIDVMEGSPPCSSFSLAGAREKYWGDQSLYSDTTQRTDDLFFEYVRLVGEVKPKVFVGENVKGLIVGKAKGYYLEIRDAFEAQGYDVGAQVLDAQWLGVPQSRQRVIIIGVRKDLGKSPAWPKPLPYRYSIRDAIPYVREIGTKKGIRSSSSPAPTVLTHARIGTQSELSVASEEERATSSFEGYAIDEEWERLLPGEKSTRYFNLVRPDPSKPSPCITQTGGNVGSAAVTHPYEKRKFTIAELRRICGFPDDFALPGTFRQQWERLGRAVPPPMMAAVARTIRDKIL